MRKTKVEKMPDLAKSFDKLQELMNGGDATRQLHNNVTSVMKEYIDLARRTNNCGEISEFIIYLFSIEDFDENINLYKEVAKQLMAAFGDMELAMHMKKVIGNDAIFKALPRFFLRIANMCEDLDRGHIRAELDLFRITQWGYKYTEEELPFLLSEYTLKRDQALLATKSK